MVAAAHFNSGEHHLTNIRNNIAREMAPEILQCCLTEFLDHYGPWQVPLAMVNDVYNIFISGKPLVKRVEPDHENTVQNSWVFTDFEIEPMNRPSLEWMVFRGLENIVGSLHECDIKGKLAETGRTPTLHYKDCPFWHTKSEIKGTNNHLDACLTEQIDGQPGHADYQDSSPNRIDLADIAVPAEFKKNLRDRIKVSTQCSTK
jgi:hypothetical protein